MPNFAPHQKNEEAIVRKVIADALAAGYILSVYDGGEIVVKLSRDGEQTLAALNSTDMDHLHFHTAEGGHVGFVSFVWGNDTDVIHDCTDNEATRAVLLGAEALSDELWEQA